MFLLYLLCFLSMLFFIKSRYFIIFKTLNSFAFVMVAICCAIQAQTTHILIILLPGLLGCMLGDILLATHLKKQFLYGLIAFLLSNIYFLVYFYHFHRFHVSELIVPIVAIIVLISLGYLPKMNYRKYEKPIMLYTFIIAWAMNKSIMCYIAFQDMMFCYSMIGFILYFLSDVILLFHRFYETTYHTQLRILNLSTYYLGLYFIAYSLIG